MTPAEIAARLTEAQKRALLWLPGDGSERRTAEASDCDCYRFWQAFRKLALLGVVHRRPLRKWPTPIMWSLTPLGREVRAIIEKEDGT